jgi:hypothetical protein
MKGGAHRRRASVMYSFNAARFAIRFIRTSPRTGRISGKRGRDIPILGNALPPLPQSRRVPVPESALNHSSSLDTFQRPDIAHMVRFARIVFCTVP